MTRFVLVPGVLALLPSYAGLSDPVLDLRLACLDAVTWLGSSGSEIVVLGDSQGIRVGHSLLSAAGVSTRLPAQPAQPPEAVLVVGNGSACRSVKAPGHLDERAFAFDESLGAALASSDTNWSDYELGESQIASLDGIRELFGLLPAGTQAVVDYDDDPFGVQYWVMRWQCES